MPILDNVACEAFPGTGVQVLITAQNRKFLESATFGFTALPSIIMRGAEGGLGLSPQDHDNPDHRPGIICQLWVAGTSAKSRAKLERQFAYRVRQALITVPTIAVFNSLDTPHRFDISNTIGQYGDGFETNVEQYGRTLLSIPLMMGHDFLIEREIAYKEGIMGGFLWLYCDSVDHGISIGEKAVAAARKYKNASVIFGVCSSGSKLRGVKYLDFGPTTNHILCPTLRDKISDSSVPLGVHSIPEIVVNAFDLPTLKQALKSIITAIQGATGLIQISSRSFNSQLGRYSIPLREL